MEPFPFTHFHDFFFEMLQKLICRSMLSSCLVVTGLSHVVLTGCIIFSNTVDHNMGMDISGMITSVCVSNNESLISRKYFPGQFHRKFLHSLSGKAAFHRILRIEADDIMMAFDIFLILILVKFCICPFAFHVECHRLTIQSIHVVFLPEDLPAQIIIKHFSAFFVMLK